MATNQNPRANAATVLELVVAVKAHCMCAKLSWAGSSPVIYYPPGFQVDGITCTREPTKAAKLRVVLERMEKDWLASFVR